MDGHRLAGHFSVEASARLIRHYRYVEERLMRLLGGWIALTPELPVKLLFGRHIWDCAQHADLWGRRLPELRSPAQQSEPASEGVVRFMDLMETAERPEDTPRRVAGVYHVLKPQLVSVYERHLEVANPVYEPPTRRILERCVDEERRHVAAGAAVLAAIVRDPARRRMAEEWEARLLAILAEAGGITGAGTVSAAAVAVHPQAVGDVVACTSAFDPAVVPADLAAAVDRHRQALERGDLAALAGEATVEVGARMAEALARLSPAFSSSRVVALAEIGAYRMVKLALSGEQGTIVLQERWQRTGGGWQVAAADVVRVEPPATASG